MCSSQLAGGGSVFLVLSFASASLVTIKSTAVVAWYFLSSKTSAAADSYHGSNSAARRPGEQPQAPVCRVLLGISADR
jgi:hypothetical protein